MAKTKNGVASIPISPDWKELFRSNSVRTSFVLTLTKPMMEFLCAVADDVHWDRSTFGNIHNPDNWISSEHALAKRGLIVRKSFDENRAATANADWTPDGAIPSCCRLTPAGEAVVELLKVAGLFVAADQSFQKKQRKA